MYRITQFGSIDIPQARPDQYVGSGECTNAVFAPLAAGGVYDLLGTNDLRPQGVGITVTGAIFNADVNSLTFETQERALRALIGKRANLYRTWQGSGDIEYVDARCIDVRAQRAIDNRNYIDLTMTFRQISNAWYGSAQTTEGYYDLDAGTDDMTTLGADSSGTDPFLFYPVVNHGGDVSQSDITITLTAGDVAITALDIKRKNAGGTVTYQHLTWAGTLVATKLLVIDCGAATITNDGANAYAAFALGASHIQDEWLTFEPGNNYLTISITGGGVGMSMTAVYYDAFA